MTKVEQHPGTSMTGIEAALISAAAKEAAGPVKSLVARLGRSGFDSLAAKFASYFQGHVNTTADKCATMKNILYKDQSVDFRSKYVHVRFQLIKSTVSDEQLLRRILEEGKVLVSGTAGAGKTMFMRWAALTLIDGMKKHGRIPLYLELRYTDKSSSELSLDQYVWNRTSSQDDRASFGSFQNALNSGLFVIILDALDEVAPSLRPGIIARIMEFIRNYPRCSLVVSTRPDESVQSIQELIVYRTTAMSLSQVREVITKLEYDEDVKSKLLKELEDGLYNRLEEFLSNPLLATIMLLTFDFGGDIPTRLTSFYKQAFEVLYQRHDATKGAFKREQYTGLSMDSFQRLFSAFCFQAYFDYKFKFTDTELISFFRDAADYTGIAVDPALAVLDTMESVCLIQREGLENVFVHRSFQEYFCALFISSYREDDLRKIIDTLAVMENRSNVLKMLYEISPEVFDYDWLLPHLDEFISETSGLRLTTKTGLRKFLNQVYDGIYVNVDTGDVEYLSWDPTRGIQLHGRWMSVAQDAKGVANIGYGSLFRGPPVWESLRQYVASLPEDVRPTPDELSERIEPSPFEDSDHPIESIRLAGADANWLLASGLPARCEEVRRSAKTHRDQVVAQRTERRSAVGQLLQRKRRDIF